MGTSQDKINAALTAHRDGLIELRRHLHANPELSNHEFATTKHIAQQLRDLGLQVHVRPEGLGLYADLTPPGFDPSRDRTVAIRSDLDALPIQEQTELSFASCNPGVMHACGHDMHMATVMGAAVALSEMGDELPGRVRFLYQHAEEVAPGGAEDLVAFGAMEGVDAVLGLHCDPERPVGRAGVKVGPMTAASDAFELTIEGTGGHTARPHHAVDPVYVGVQVAQALYGMGGRLLDARDPVVLAIGVIQAGKVPNAIPNSVTIKGTVRTLSKKHREESKPWMRKVIEGICAGYGATFSLSFNEGAPAIHNDAQIMGLLEGAAQDVLGGDAIDQIPLPSMGAEDFSYYLEHAPGAMFRLGTALPDEPRHLLHTPFFNPSEEAIGLGARILSLAAMRFLSQK